MRPEQGEQFCRPKPIQVLFVRSVRGEKPVAGIAAGRSCPEKIWSVLLAEGPESVGQTTRRRRSRPSQRPQNG